MSQEKVMKTSVMLIADADAGLRGQFVAHITGRDQRWIYNRNWVGNREGQRTEATITTEGLFEVCDVSRKHGKRSTFYVVAAVPSSDPKTEPLVLRKVPVLQGDALRAAQELQDGQRPNWLHLYVQQTISLEEDLIKKSLERDQETAIDPRRTRGGLTEGVFVARGESVRERRSYVETLRALLVPSEVKKASSDLEEARNALSVLTMSERVLLLQEFAPPDAGPLEKEGPKKEKAPRRLRTKKSKEDTSTPATTEAPPSSSEPS